MTSLGSPVPPPQTGVAADPEAGRGADGRATEADRSYGRARCCASAAETAAEVAARAHQRYAEPSFPVRRPVGVGAVDAARLPPDAERLPAVRPPRRDGPRSRSVERSASLVTPPAAGPRRTGSLSATAECYRRFGTSTPPKTP